MTIHDGRSWSKEDTIDPLGSKDQYYPTFNTVTGHSGQRMMLGIDTEMLLLGKDNKILWPHKLGLPQERCPKDPRVGDGSGTFDFHGDGYAIEFNISPFTCLDQALGKIGKGFNWAKFNFNTNKISAPPMYDVPKAVVDDAPDEVKLLGCMPSANIYGDKGEPKSLSATQRTTGCHLHISHPVLKDPEVAGNLVRWADILVGCTWTYISPKDSTEEAKRRLAYGRAGEFRLKAYEGGVVDDYSTGVEYRVLPGTPIQHPAYITLMFNLYRSAMRLAATKGSPAITMSLEAQKAINTADKKLAKSIIRQLPWTDGGRKLIRWFRRVNLETKGLSDWYQKTIYLEGHASLYQKEHIALSPLSL